VQVLLAERPPSVAGLHAVRQARHEARRDAGGPQQQDLGSGELLAEAQPVNEQEPVHRVLARTGHGESSV
jgi:hypothetical protein